MLIYFNKINDRSNCLVHVEDTTGAIMEYRYDANGKLTEISLPEGGRIYYVYDGDNRMVEERHEEKSGGLMFTVTVRNIPMT